SDERLVVDDQHPDRLGHAPITAVARTGSLAPVGTVAVTSVPTPGWDSTVREPPTRSIRSRIPRRPWPTRTASTSKPCPSSVTATRPILPSSSTRTVTAVAAAYRRALVKASCTTRYRVSSPTVEYPLSSPSTDNV